MSLEGDIALLKRVPLFADLPVEQLRLVAFSSVRVDLEAKQVLFREGAQASTGYVVSNGGVELTRGDGGRKKSVVRCEAGSLIGELALFIETQRPATAIAVVASQLLEIDRKLITRMLHEYPHLALGLRTKLAERLTATMSELSQVRRLLIDAGRTGHRR